MLTTSIRFRLSLMMFLQFFIWGAWYTSVAVFMTAEGMENLTHWPFTVNPVAAIVAPFFLGLIADRYFATERVLAVLHLLGGALLLIAPTLVGNPLVFILVLLLYNLCYMPTIGLTTSLSFHQMDNQEEEFPLIRVWGTIGWIIAGLFISFVLGDLVGTEGVVEATAWPLRLAGIASLVLGGFSFTLPHTPPPARGEKVTLSGIAGIDALRELGSRSFYIFIASALLICIALAAYYNFTQLYLGAAGFENIAGTQTIGQMSEVIFMLLIPVFFRRLGVKWMVMIAMLAFVLRYALFAWAAPSVVTWMILIGIALHGVCYDFFFVTGQIYVDKLSTPGIRGQAQGFYVLITYGVGMLIGAQIMGSLYNAYLGDREILSLDQWANFWWLPAGFALLAAVFFFLFFREPKPESST
jgi:nucleoside transporter